VPLAPRLDDGCDGPLRENVAPCRVPLQADVVRHEPGRKRAAAEAKRRDHVARERYVGVGKEAVRAGDRHQSAVLKIKREVVGDVLLPDGKAVDRNRPGHGKSGADEDPPILRQETSWEGGEGSDGEIPRAASGQSMEEGTEDGREVPHWQPCVDQRKEAQGALFYGLRRARPGGAAQAHRRVLAVGALLGQTVGRSVEVAVAEWQEARTWGETVEPAVLCRCSGSGYRSGKCRGVDAAVAKDVLGPNG
jgi:hypothetical protein